MEIVASERVILKLEIRQCYLKEATCTWREVDFYFQFICHIIVHTNFELV